MTEKDLLNIATKQDFLKILDYIQLTDRQKDIFMLKYGLGKMNEDIAAEIGFCRKTVTNELNIIRSKLAKIPLE